jgi:hypothetical protein
VMNGTSGAGSGAGCSGPGGGTMSGLGVAGGMISGTGRSGPGIGGGCGPCGGTSGDWAADVLDIRSRLFRWCLAEASGGARGSHRGGRTTTRVTEGGGRGGGFSIFSPPPLTGRGWGEPAQPCPGSPSRSREPPSPLTPLREGRGYHKNRILSRFRGYPTRRRSSVRGCSRDRVGFGSGIGPGVWPMGKKRARRRASASLALTGNRS